ncbi:MAG: hypothetical protein ABW055_10465, partial [Pararhizobium sp.]
GSDEVLMERISGFRRWRFVVNGDRETSSGGLATVTYNESRKRHSAQTSGSSLCDLDGGEREGAER